MKKNTVENKLGGLKSQTVLDMGAAHTASADRLLASYREIPAGAPVRLAKRTSNLFRSRTRVAGLNVSGLQGVISVDAEARTADVQGMCTYDDLVEATLAYGLIPLVVPSCARSLSAARSLDSALRRPVSATDCRTNP